tara:strand:- start:452 stop:631 length:180 start_codon:yes stop_codon:yes gene_type:complete
MIRLINNLMLTIMEKLDRRESSLEIKLHNLARRIFNKTFFKLNGYSAYDYRKNFEYFEE